MNTSTAMNPLNPPHCTAFAAERRIASGPLPDVSLKAKALLEADPHAAILIFDDASGEQIDLDFRAGLDQAAPAEARGPGRPKLGVVAREITLLPRHWDWLNTQPGGASVALRKLVEDARRAGAGPEMARRAQQAALRFMTAMAGNLPDFEEAARALYAARRDDFEQLTAAWPADIRDHARQLAQAAFAPVSGPQGKE